MSHPFAQKGYIMDKNELWKLYCTKEREFERAKGKRAIITILGFSVMYFCLFFIFGKPSGLTEFGETVVFAIVTASIHFFINAAVFSGLLLKSQAEKQYLESIKKKIDEKQ